MSDVKFRPSARVCFDGGDISVGLCNETCSTWARIPLAAKDYELPDGDFMERIIAPLLSAARKKLKELQVA